MKNRYFKVCKLIVLASAIIITVAGCSPKSPTLVKQEELVLGTFGQISAYSNSEKAGNEAISKSFEKIREIENLMSTSIENSDVYNINHNAGKSAVAVSPDTMKVILKGLEYGQLTERTFNIGLGSLIDLWGIGKDWQKVPTDEEISEARNHIDLDQLEVSKGQGTVMIKDPQMLIDLGGIAKGYSVDEAVRILKEEGIESGFVNLGGDVYALGTKPDGSPWNIGIQNPEIGANGVIARVPLANQSIVTSGDYERYFIENDVRYHHIIDPATGYPSNNELVSVTIISKTSIDGDVLSTSAFILGLDKGLELIENFPNVEGIFITRDHQMYITSGMKGKVEILDDNFKIVN